MTPGGNEKHIIKFLNAMRKFKQLSGGEAPMVGAWNFTNPCIILLNAFGYNEKLIYGAVWLWCIGEGYEEQQNKESFIDAAFLKDQKTTGFIFEFNKTVDEML